MDEDGYLYIMARTDDIINVAGHRLSTGGMEEVLAGHPNVAEMRRDRHRRPAQGPGAGGLRGAEVGRGAHRRRHREGMREAASARRSARSRRFKTVVVVPRLPKTRSGKILRATMRKIADREEFKTPATIDDPAILDEIRSALAAKGIGV